MFRAFGTQELCGNHSLVPKKENSSTLRCARQAASATSPKPSSHSCATSELSARKPSAASALSTPGLACHPPARKALGRSKPCCVSVSPSPATQMIKGEKNRCKKCLTTEYCRVSCSQMVPYTLFPRLQSRFSVVGCGDLLHGHFRHAVLKRKAGPDALDVGDVALIQTVRGENGPSEARKQRRS